MKTFLFLSVLLLVSSCGLVELEDASEHQDAWVSAIPSTGDFYAVGVDYPDDYDWRSDPEYGQVACSLVVWMNGRKIIKIPAGNRYEVSTDPDACRMVGGQLYTDFSTRNMTVVKANGKELFRYAGREQLVGFSVEGSDVYTLGNSRDGNGCSFRKNGDVLFSDPSARAYAHMTGKEGNYSFCFWKMENIGEEFRPVNYMYDAGTAVRIRFPEEVTGVYDALVQDGKPVCSVSVKESAYPVLMNGRDMLWLEDNNYIVGKGCNSQLYLTDSGDIYVYACMGCCTSVLWKDGQVLLSSFEFEELLSLRTYGSQYLCYMIRSVFGHGDAVWFDGGLIRLPLGFSAFGCRPVCLWQGEIYVALNPLEEGKPVIWSEDGMQEIDINGCLYELGVAD